MQMGIQVEQDQCSQCSMYSACFFFAALTRRQSKVAKPNADSNTVQTAADLFQSVATAESLTEFRLQVQKGCEEDIS